jgi:hypothetical protein
MLLHNLIPLQLWPRSQATQPSAYTSGWLAFLARIVRVASWSGLRAFPSLGRTCGNGYGRTRTSRRHAPRPPRVHLD